MPTLEVFTIGTDQLLARRIKRGGGGLQGTVLLHRGGTR